MLWPLFNTIGHDERWTDLSIRLNIYWQIGSERKACLSVRRYRPQEFRRSHAALDGALVFVS